MHTTPLANDEQATLWNGPAGRAWVDEQDLKDVDAGVRDEVDQATDACVDDPLPDAATALDAVYAEPARAETLWYRLA